MHYSRPDKVAHAPAAVPVDDDEKGDFSAAENNRIPVFPRHNAPEDGTGKFALVGAADPSE